MVWEFSLIVLYFYEHGSVTIDNFRSKTLLLRNRIPLLIKTKWAITSDRALPKDRNPHQVVRQVLYDTGNYFNKNSVRSWTNEERFKFLTIFENHNLGINFISISYQFQYQIQTIPDFFKWNFECSNDKSFQFSTNCTFSMSFTAQVPLLFQIGLPKTGVSLSRIVFISDARPAQADIAFQSMPSKIL